MKKHPFEPSTVVIRRHGSIFRRTSTCRVCQKPGREVKTDRSGRNVTFWQHVSRPAEEPIPPEGCPWGAEGGMWCCRPAGHSVSHHVHRGPRRNVGH